MNCRICDFSQDGAPQIIVKEMMFGKRQNFKYLRCPKCDVLQIAQVPSDLWAFYSDYYTADKKYNHISGARKLFWRIRSYGYTSQLSKIFLSVSYNTILHWSMIAQLRHNSRILDVGCGNGDILFEFSKHGFNNLFGIDPNLCDNLPDGGFSFSNTDLLNYNDSKPFDFIMFNHSFEHIIEQKETLRKAVQILKPGGVIMIRIPVLNQAFEIYKENWVQLDAPRHIFLHSFKSMAFICNLINLNIFHSFCDSTEFQFLGSEQFKNDIPTYSERSYKNGIEKSMFTLEQIDHFKDRAKEFNSRMLGDQAAFFLTRKLL